MKKTFFLLTALCLSLAFCKKDKDLSSDAAFYFVGKFGGEGLKLEKANDNDVDLTYLTCTDPGAPDCSFGYGCIIGGPCTDPANPRFTITFPGLFSGDCSTESSVFPTLFRTGSWDYGDTGGKVQVSYYDGKETWSSTGGPQTGSTFEVTKSVGTSTRNVGGTFTCTLYSASGAAKKLNGASFVLNFLPRF